MDVYGRVDNHVLSVGDPFDYAELSKTFSSVVNDLRSDTGNAPLLRVVVSDSISQHLGERNWAKALPDVDMVHYSLVCFN